MEDGRDRGRESTADEVGSQRAHPQTSGARQRFFGSIVMNEHKQAAPPRRATRGFFPVVAGNDVHIQQAGGVVFVAKRHLSIEQGGGQVLASAGTLDVRQGGGTALIAKEA